MLSRTEIAEAVCEAARECGACKAILFGSFARGTATARSDLDVVFVEETAVRFLDRLGRYLDRLADRLHVAVDVLVYTPAEFERMQGGSFMKRIAREGKVLYERGEVERGSAAVVATGRRRSHRGAAQPAQRHVQLGVLPGVAGGRESTQGRLARRRR